MRERMKKEGGEGGGGGGGDARPSPHPWRRRRTPSATRLQNHLCSSSSAAATASGSQGEEGREGEQAGEQVDRGCGQGGAKEVRKGAASRQGRQGQAGGKGSGAGVSSGGQFLERRHRCKRSHARRRGGRGEFAVRARPALLLRPSSPQPRRRCAAPRRRAKLQAERNDRQRRVTGGTCAEACGAAGLGGAGSRLKGDDLPPRRAEPAGGRSPGNGGAAASDPRGPLSQQGCQQAGGGDRCGGRAALPGHRGGREGGQGEDARHVSRRQEADTRTCVLACWQVALRRQGGRCKEGGGGEEDGGSEARGGEEDAGQEGCQKGRQEDRRQAARAKGPPRSLPRALNTAPRLCPGGVMGVLPFALSHCASERAQVGARGAYRDEEGTRI